MIPHTLAIADEEMALILTAMVAGTALCFYVIHVVRKIFESRGKEQTKREVAAYVAEGSISADDAAKILNAGGDNDAAATIADGVAWGTVSAKQAEKLIRTLKSDRPDAEGTPAPAR